MTKTNCQRRDCLNFYVRRERMEAPKEISCLANISEPLADCVRYTPPSWKPFHHQSQSARLKKE